jgi:hypothetical protein
MDQLPAKIEQPFETDNNNQPSEPMIEHEPITSNSITTEEQDARTTAQDHIGPIASNLTEYQPGTITGTITEHQPQNTASETQKRIGDNKQNVWLEFMGKLKLYKDMHGNCVGMYSDGRSTVILVVYHSDYFFFILQSHAVLI